MESVSETLQRVFSESEKQSLSDRVVSFSLCFKETDSERKERKKERKVKERKAKQRADKERGGRVLRGMVHYGCAKTDSGGVECFVEFSETPRCSIVSDRPISNFHVYACNFEKFRVFVGPFVTIFPLYNAKSFLSPFTMAPVTLRVTPILSEREWSNSLQNLTRILCSTISVIVKRGAHDFRLVRNDVPLPAKYLEGHGAW